MTHFSRSLSVLRNGPIPHADLERRDLPSEHLGGFPGIDSRLGPFDLSAWADRQGLPTAWVDGAWARVMASADEVRRFCREFLPPDSAAEMERLIEDGRTYVIGAEEF
ncbi:MAG: hypothetical protein DWQ53_09785 [Microcystis flos-aquae DF17]|nr:MAG: hypothetical protein DWQ53_09785 [Microcystis flos-aquae DF17]